ncbi:MAG: biotin synthase BioB [Omnitrophica bacterium RIFOXYB12_FULL_50_7]|nr:MAG: biotin synthase BioB [Omnitrophica bacterium RIFOXYB12_FULL_50_7]
MKAFIQELKTRVLAGGDITPGEALRLSSITDSATLDLLLSAAHEITTRFRPSQPDLCSLVNAKSYLCSEDCGFCSQSSHYKTGVKRYPLMSPEEILGEAKKSEANGVQSFCVVTSGETLNDAEFEKVLAAFHLLSEKTRLRLDGSLGNLTPEQIRKLRAAGMRRFNHNLQCSREFYPKIVSTHTYDERKETLDFLKENGVEICSGGIFGMGETPEDRIRLAFELKPYDLHCLPINILNPRPGTPLAGQQALAPEEIIKMVAIFRFIHPQANIKLAGGRELNLGVYFQEKALRGGANGFVVGGYLTTTGNPLQEDLDMLKYAGYDTNTSKAVSATHFCCSAEKPATASL